MALDEQTVFGLEALSTLRADNQPVPAPLLDLINSKLVKVADAIATQLSDAGSTKPIVWQGTGGRKWNSEQRLRTGNGQAAKVVSSLPLGESYVGTYSTATFNCPDKLSFWLCGHDGPPNVPAAEKNAVRLVLTSTGKTIATAAPPRNDALHPVEWTFEGVRWTTGTLGMRRWR